MEGQYLQAVWQPRLERELGLAGRILNGLAALGFPADAFLQMQEGLTFWAQMALWVAMLEVQQRICSLAGLQVDLQVRENSARRLGWELMVVQGKSEQKKQEGPRARHLLQVLRANIFRLQEVQ